MESLKYRELQSKLEETIQKLKDNLKSLFFKTHKKIDKISKKTDDKIAETLKKKKIKGEITTFKSTKLGKAARIAFEINKATKKTKISVTNIKNTSHNRFKLGDVEINNPNLNYRQTGSGAIENFYKTGEQFVPIDPNIPINSLKYELENMMDGVPMYKQGSLWYGPPSNDKGYPELFVTAEPLAHANKHASILNDFTKAGRTKKGETFWDVRPIDHAGRRVPFNKSQLNRSNVSTYKYESGYGYRKYPQKYIPTLEEAIKEAKANLHTKNSMGNCGYRPCILGS